MVRQRMYDDLTNQQRWALQALKAELAETSPAETIAECIRLRWWGKSVNDVAKADFRRAYSSARAVQLVMSYLRYLEDLNGRLLRMSKAIHHRINHPYPQNREEVLAYVMADVEATEMSGVFEILITDFANTCIQLYGLLKKAAEGSEYEIPPADLEYLNHYRPLRDYYAHIYNRLPGGTNEKEIVTEIDDERGFQIIIGFEIDEQQRVIWGDMRIEVNTPGMEKVSEIVRRNLRAFAPAAIASLHTYFVQHPENIPPPSAVRRQSLARTAREVERESRTKSRESQSGLS